MMLVELDCLMFKTKIEVQMQHVNLTNTRMSQTLVSHECRLMSFYPNHGKPTNF